MRIVEHMDVARDARRTTRKALLVALRQLATRLGATTPAGLREAMLKHKEATVVAPATARVLLVKLPLGWWCWLWLTDRLEEGVVLHVAEVSTGRPGVRAALLAAGGERAMVRRADILASLGISRE